MKKIRILTDSSSDFCPPYPENLTILPMTIHFGNEDYQDNVTISHRDFYEKLEACADLPTTSLIAPGAFEAVFDKAAADGETVIALTISSKLSGTYQSACLAADGREDVFVIDSLNATLGLQILVQYALQLVQRGLPAEAIVEELERSKSRIHVLGLPATLEYLKRGGRISKTVAIVGEALSIKPVLALSEGEIIVLGKARGSKNGNNFLVKEIEKSNGVCFTMPYCLGYTGLSEELLNRYIEDSRQLWEGKTDRLPISTVGATIGTHVGPGAILIAYFDNNF